MSDYEDYFVFLILPYAKNEWRCSIGGKLSHAWAIEQTPQRAFFVALARVLEETRYIGGGE